MRRLIAVIAFVLMFASVSSAVYAADAPVPTVYGEVASKAISKDVSQTLRVWASRVSRHDERALSMMSDDVIMVMFSTNDPAYLTQQFMMRQETTINDVDVFLREGNEVVALVSFTGFDSRRGYHTVLFTMVENGDYYQLSKVEFLDASIPTDASVSELDLSFAGGTAEFSASQIERADYVTVKVTNADSMPHHLVLYQVGADRTKVANQLAQQAFAPGQGGSIVILGQAAENYEIDPLPVGDYVIVDMVNQGAEVGTFTLK